MRIDNFVTRLRYLLYSAANVYAYAHLKSCLSKIAFCACECSIMNGILNFPRGERARKRSIFRVRDGSPTQRVAALLIHRQEFSRHVLNGNLFEFRQAFKSK